MGSTVRLGHPFVSNPGAGGTAGRTAKNGSTFAQNCFVTELCNVRLWYIKAPVREFNFVSPTLIQGTSLAKNISRNSSDVGEGAQPLKLQILTDSPCVNWHC